MSVMVEQKGTFTRLMKTIKMEFLELRTKIMKF